MSINEDNANNTGMVEPPNPMMQQPQQPLDVNRVSLKLTTFWTSKPAAWFGRAEAQFRAANITRSTTKFDAVVSVLAENQCDTVLDLLTNTPPENDDPYQQLKNRLLQENSLSDTKRFKTLLNEMSLGDRKPSTLLREMKLLAPEMDDTFLKNVWMERLPSHMRGILSATKGNLTELGVTADAIAEHTSSSYLNEASLRPPVKEQRSQGISMEDFDKLVKRIEKLESTSRRRQHSQTREERKYPMCRFHFKYGEKARKCEEPCNFTPGVSTNQKN